MNRSLQRRPTHCTPTKRPTLLPQLGRALPQGFWYTKLDSWARHAEVKMAESWAADVKKYVPDANDKAISGIVKYCGIALQNRDSSLVSFTDPEEVARVISARRGRSLTRSITRPSRRWLLPMSV